MWNECRWQLLRQTPRGGEFPRTFARRVGGASLGEGPEGSNRRFGRKGCERKCGIFFFFLKTQATLSGLPLVSSVLKSTEPPGEVERAVWSQAGVHPLGEMEDLGRRESFPLALFSLQPTLAATGRALVSAPEEKTTLAAVNTQPVTSITGCVFSPVLPAASVFLGSVPTGSFLHAADEEGQGHGEDDDATHH